MTDPSPVIECRCPACGWYVLIAPDVVDMPCPCNEFKPGACPGKITATEDATEGLKARVVVLLKRIEWEAGGHEDACPVCFARSTGPRGHPIEKKHAEGCLLARVLRECCS